MKILQVHLGYLSEKRKECIRSVLDKVTFKDYYLVSNHNFLNNNINHININEYIKEIDELEYFCLHDKNMYSVISDYIRFHFAINNRIFYVDTDVFLHEMPVINSNQLFVRKNRSKTIDYFMFYLDNKMIANKIIFDLNKEIMKYKQITRKQSILSINGYLTSIRENLDFFPKIYYTHFEGFGRF